MRGADKLFTENVANDCEGPVDLRYHLYGPWGKNLYLMHGCGDHVYVWADSFEDAFEELVEWLDENNHHCLTTVTEDDLREAADDLGVDWDDDWPNDSNEFEEVREHAEADLTVIGHTTLKHGTHIPSDEWGGSDVTDPDEIEAVARHSMALCNDHDFLGGDYVEFNHATGRFIVDDISNDDINIESIPPGNGYRHVDPSDLKHASKTPPARRFHTREAFDAEEETFDGLPRRRRLMDLFRRRR